MASYLVVRLLNKHSLIICYSLKKPDSIKCFGPVPLPTMPFTVGDAQITEKTYGSVLRKRKEGSIGVQVWSFVPGCSKIKRRIKLQGVPEVPFLIAKLQLALSAYKKLQNTQCTKPV